MESFISLFKDGIKRLSDVGIEVKVSSEPNLGCNLQLVSYTGDLSAIELYTKMEKVLSVRNELQEFWKPVLLDYTPAKQKKTDLFALTDRLLKMELQVSK